MTQCLFRRRCLDRLQRPGAEWPARRGQDDTFDVLARARAERLEYGVVLGIDWQHGGAGNRRAPHEQGARTNQTFLVGERNGRAAFDGRERRFQSDCAADRPHQPIGGPLRSFKQGALAGRRFDPTAGQGVLQIAVCRWIGNHRKPGADLAGDFRQRRRIAPRADGLDAITFRLALDQIDRVVADRSRRAEDGDAAHGCRRLHLRSDAPGSGHAFTTPTGHARRRQNRRATVRLDNQGAPPPRNRQAGPSRRHGRE